MKGFKKCENGHWYPNNMSKCSYCQGMSGSSGNETGTIPGSGDSEPTIKFPGDSSGSGTKTEIICTPPLKKDEPKAKKGNFDASKTYIPIEFMEGESEKGGIPSDRINFSARRLAGWLVTYTHDPYGADYKLYEGRNMIGRNLDCQITVDDKKMSGEHAIILYKNKKFFIEDSMSTHGTIVNLKDIGVRNAVYLQDGDIIEMGETIFCFKTTGIENT